MNYNDLTKDELIKIIQLATFEAIETNLFLDTHPKNTEAINALEKYNEKRLDAVNTYFKNFGPLFSYDVKGSSESFNWVLTPFPWETEV